MKWEDLNFSEERSNVMKKIVAILLFCVSISFASQEEDGSIYYGADPESPNLKTHVFLCRMGNAHRVPRSEGCLDKFINDHECGCSACVDGSRIGLALAFIRADTMGRDVNEYLKVTDTTRNILWSAFMSFGCYLPEDYHNLPMECCEKARKVLTRMPGKLNFMYAYNVGTFRTYVGGLEENRRLEFRLTHTGPILVELNEYPHNRDPRVSVIKFLGDLRSHGEDTHHLKRILRSVVYGWTIRESTLPEILRKIGDVCSLDGNGRRIVPDYNYAGSRGCNCARFCMEVLDKLVLLCRE